MSYLGTKLFFGPIINSYIGEIDGKENIPEGPFIAASNHFSFADDLILPFTLIRITNKKTHVFVNSRFYKNYLIKKFLDHYKMIPVDVAKNVADKEKRKKTNEAAFKKALRYINKGNIMAIFPEGGRSKDGRLKKGKTGVARLALEAKVPVVPIGIKGSYDIMPKGAKFPRFRKADIVFDKPLYFRYNNKSYKTKEMITRKIMKRIAFLIGQDYRY